MKKGRFLFAVQFMDQPIGGASCPPGRLSGSSEHNPGGEAAQASLPRPGEASPAPVKPSWNTVLTVGLRTWETHRQNPLAKPLLDS